MKLALHEWGDEGAPRVVCLHGVRNHGRHFARLAAELSDHHVVAVDLLGHGHSPWEPPWDIDAHIDAIVETVGARASILIGHSFGGRLAFELAARAPKLVPKLVLLDPVIVIPGHVALAAAENARIDKSYVSFDELIERRYDESQLHFAPRELVVEDLASHAEVGDDGRLRYRYCQSAVVAAYGEMASQPPRFEDVRVPTLVVLGERSYLPYDHLLERTSSGSRRPARSRRRPGRTHRSLGRARRDDRGDRRLPRAFALVPEHDEERVVNELAVVGWERRDVRLRTARTPTERGHTNLREVGSTAARAGV